MKDCPVVMDLHEFAPVGGRAAGGRDGRRLERFAEVCEDLASRGRSHPGLLPLANLRFEVSRLLPAVFSEPNIAAAVRALERKLLPHPGHEFRPGNSGGVVRPGMQARRHSGRSISKSGTGRHEFGQAARANRRARAIARPPKARPVRITVEGSGTGVTVIIIPL